MLAPNKQNLLLLKSQTKMIKSGLKLLKEKRNGLIILFLDIAKQGKILEERLQKDQKNVLGFYDQALTFVSYDSLNHNIEEDTSLDLTTSKKKISGVQIENLSIDLSPKDRSNLKIDIRKSLNLFASIFADMIQLSQFRINTQRLSKEIQKTSRQINNLEKRLEDVGSQIKYITSRIGEKENLEKATLIKIFGT